MKKTETTAAAAPARLSKKDRYKNLASASLGQIDVGVSGHSSSLESQSSMQEVDLSLVDLNPKNVRRKLRVTYEMVDNYRTSKDRAAFMANLQELDRKAASDLAEIERLAESIMECGLISTPMLQKKQGGRLEVMVGNRRILALRLIGLKHEKLLVKAPQTDDVTEKVGHAENEVRVNLDPDEQFLSIKDNYLRLKNGRVKVDMNAFARRIAVQRSWAFELVGLLESPAQFQAAIEDGRIRTLSDASTMLSQNDIPAGVSRKEVDSLIEAFYAARAAKPITRKAPGQPSSKPVSYRLGAVTSPAPIQRIIRAVFPERADELFTGINWEDPKAVAKAWSAFIAQIQEGQHE